jgi:NTE family protein
VANVLYLTAHGAAFHDLVENAQRQSWLEVAVSARGATFSDSTLALELEAVHDVEVAVERLRVAHYRLLVVDCRAVAWRGDAPAHDHAAAAERLFTLLHQLRAEPDRERRFRFDRILVLVGDSDHGGDDHGGAVDRLLFGLGQRRIGGFVRATGSDPAARDRLIAAFWKRAGELLAPAPNKKALCAAGGGITGVYYELGVLKCLHDAFGGYDVRRFDMYFGISAGAIVTSLVANGLSVDEIIRRVDPRNRGEDGFRLEIDVRDLTVGDLPARVVAVLRHLRDYGARVMAGTERLTVTGAASQLAAFVGPIFHSANKAQQFSTVLAEPGRSDDFRQLPVELYIGATDQDSREHVLFGALPHRHVPISRAVQASAAIHPFFRSVEIEGRRYTDGFVTRTSNLTAAIERNANLVFVIDPFLPVIADEPGFNAAHSALWVMMQDYKTVAYTRYEQVSKTLLDQHPEVACYSFFPSNRMRRLMTSNPISTANFDPIVCEAYASTYRRLRRIEYKLGPVLESHGIALDLTVASRRVKMMRAMLAPQAVGLCV